MRQEMRKLNRAKYACSEEEARRLTADGYTMVDTEPEPDGTGQAADPTQDQEGKSQTADSGEKKGKRGAGKK